jgi:hypothetical protein
VRQGTSRTTRTIRDDGSPFATVEMPSTSELGSERDVRYLLLSGRQDDGPWGPIGAVWLSKDGERGGFLVHPWAIEAGAEMARGYRGALARGFTPSTVFEYWAGEPWTPNVVVDEQRRVETLLLVRELLDVL